MEINLGHDIKDIWNINTTTSNITFSPVELKRIQEYDQSRLHTNQKIIAHDDTSGYRVFPIRLTNAVESGDIEITELRIVRQMREYFLCSYSILDTIKNLRPTHLHILTLFRAHWYSVDRCKHDIVEFIKRYEGTTDQLTLHFEEVLLEEFAEIYKAIEDFTLSKPIKINITAGNDICARPCEDFAFYHYIQERIQFLMSCKSYSEVFKITTEKEEREQLCAEIIENDPKFAKNFIAHEAVKATKTAMGDNMYNTLLWYYIDNSITMIEVSDLCFEATRKHLPDNAKEIIVKYVGGIAAITKTDKNLKDNNSTTAQQDEVINHDEAVNDINLITSGTAADCNDCLF